MNCTAALASPWPVRILPAYNRATSAANSNFDDVGESLRQLEGDLQMIRKRMGLSLRVSLRVYVA